MTSNLIVAQAYLDQLWSRRNLYFIDLLVAEDCHVRDPLFGEGTGHDHVKGQVCEMHLAFPDLAYTVGDIIADAGDQVALRWSARGTHRGSLIGIPATQRAIAISGILLLRVANAKLIAITSVWDPYEMLQQLLLVPVFEVDPPVAPVEVVDAAVMRASAQGVDIDAQWEL